MTPHLKQIKQYKHGEGFSIAGLTPWNWTQQPQTTSNQIVCKIYEANEINIWSVSLIDETFIYFWSFSPASQEGTIIVLHVPRVLRVLQNVVTEWWASAVLLWESVCFFLFDRFMMIVKLNVMDRWLLVLGSLVIDRFIEWYQGVGSVTLFIPW